MKWPIQITLMIFPFVDICLLQLKNWLELHDVCMFYIIEVTEEIIVIHSKQLAYHLPCLQFDIHQARRRGVLSSNTYCIQGLFLKK